MRTLIATFGSVAIALAIAAPSASAGGFAPAAGSPIPVGLSPVSVALGDFNGDGKLDAANAGTNDVSVLLGDGRGGFSPAPGSPFPTNGNNAFSIAIGDFNLDGKLDAAVTNLLSGSVAVMLGDGTGRLTHAPGSPLGGVGYPLSVVVGDVNSDGTPDAVVANGRENEVISLLSDGHGAFDPVRSPVGGFEAFALALADFDRDGKLDVAVADVGTQEVTVFRGDGLGGFTFLSRQATGGDAISIASGDFNSDGSPDVIVTNLVAGTVLLLLGDGHGGLAPAPGSPYTPKGCCSGSSSLPESVAVGDFNGDGNADAAVTLRSGVSGPEVGEVAVLLGDGRGHLSPASGTPVPAGGRSPSWVAVGDLNGDGRPDLVTANFLSATVSVLINYKNAQAVCEALRASMGDGAFARRYGTNANKANAFGQCVKQNKGF